MKIIYLHQYFNTPDMIGGTRSYEMARRMVAAGHEVEMITSRVDGTFEGRGWTIEDVDGIRVHWLPVAYNNAMSIARRLIAFTEFARRAGYYASTLEGDVVFASSTPLTIAIPGVWVSRKLHVPLVFEVRDLWPEVPIAMGALSFPGSAMLARKLEMWAYRNAKKIVVLSPGMKQGVVDRGVDSDKVVCIPNSADLELFQCPETVGQEFRWARPWLEDRPLVLYAGTFGKVNGVDYMVKLASAMHNLNPEVRFLAVGAGAEKGAVIELAESLGLLNVNFFVEDPVPKRDVAKLFSAATVCCSWVVDLEALWKNSANKVFDSMAAGKPVVINHGGWQKQLIEDNGIGLCLPIGDEKAAATMLNDLLLDEGALSSAGNLALSIARNHFSRDELAKQLMDAIEEVAGS